MNNCDMENKGICRRLVKAAAAVPALFALWCHPAAGQRYERTVERNLWNTTSNVCGIRSDSVSVSQAQIYGRCEDGGFHDLSDARRLWKAGAFAETMSHFRRVSMTGRFSFDHEEAYETCGSMLSTRGVYPVDIYEFTPGRKTRQTYRVDGGVAAELNRWLTAGGKVEYLSSNRAKRKDLRYTDYLMDLRVSPSLLFRLGDGISAGIAYGYRCVAENINAEALGVSSDSYYAFFDKGMMYGSYDVWTGGSSHLKEAGVSGFPLRRNIHSLSLQFSAGGFIAELEGMLGSGKAGEKDVRWYSFGNRGFSFLSGWSGGAHRATLEISADHVTDSEDIIDRVTENGVTTTVNYGSRGIYGKTSWNVSPEYRYLHGPLEIRTGASFHFSEEASHIAYPYVAEVSEFFASAHVSGMYSIRGFDLGLGLEYGGGGWKDRLDNTDTSVSVSAAPVRLDGLGVQGQWYAAAMEYRTVSRLGVCASLRYNFRFGLFLGASGSLVRGFSTKSLIGRHRATASLNVGYLF